MVEAFRRRIGLGHRLLQASGFCLIVAVATRLGVGLNFTPLDPVKALYWSAVLNGVISTPIMVVIMLMAVRADMMAKFVIGHRLKVLGWRPTGVMALVVVAMVARWIAR